jgi:predicted AlkP superfamily pyrophosphatase or phosphodiesterase
MGAAMRWYSKLAAAALAALLQACATAPLEAPAPLAAVETRVPIVLLVSIDGFRSDYLDRGVTPILSRLAAEGVRGPMRPSFPTKTYPNHWTLVTGLRPDRHGVVANRMEDPARPGETFTMDSDDPFWWSAARPVWLDAERAGIRTAPLFWPGSNVAIGGYKDKPGDWETHGGERPSDWQQFNQAIPQANRVDAVIDLLRRPAATRPKLLTLYFDTVDSAGHDFGPDDPRTLAAVAEVDRLIGTLVGGLAALGQPANLVIVADHGMGATSSTRTIALDAIAPPEQYRAIETGPFATLVPQPGFEARLDKALLAPHAHMQCWRKAEIPARLHYGRNPRVAPYLCLAEKGWLIAEKPPASPAAGGNHGWDNQDPAMLALFVAHGPGFARGKTLPAFDNVDVYPLLRRLLGLPPASDVDGSEAVFANVLIRP